MLEQEPAGDGPDADAERGHARPDADGLAALTQGSVNTLVMIDRVAGMMNAPPMPMSERVKISMVAESADRGHERADAEDGEADREEAVPAEPVAEASGGEQQTGEDEGVGVDDPLELAGGRAEAAFARRVGQRRQRDVEDRVVEDDHDEADAQHEQRQPPSAIDGGRVSKGIAHKCSFVSGTESKRNRLGNEFGHPCSGYGVGMTLPEITTRDEWLKARKKLWKQEKELTHRRDKISADRRRLPMVKIEKEYVFEGPKGPATLLDLFEDHSQLIVGHFMFDPEWDEGCPSCSAGADEMSDGHLMHLHARDTTFAYVSRAPIESIERYKLMKAWTFPWYSSYGSDFNYDFHVTLDPAIATPEYNYVPFDMTGQDAKSVELPGRSHFLRVGDDIFHTYSVFARGLESIGGSYYLLDETALGRQEEWEEPKGRADSARSATPDFAS